MAPATTRTVTDTFVPRPLFAEWVNIREEISTGILQMAPELAQVFALFGVLTRQTRVSDDCRLACTPNGGKGADLAISTFCCGQQIVDSN
jgi:hypothetical protein